VTVYFPATIKPVTSQGYGFGTPDNVLSVETMGGNPIQVLDYRIGPVVVSCTIVGNRQVRSVMSDFYYGKIQSGAGKFYMNLDTGLGIEEHICSIVPGSMKFDGGRDPLWVISFDVRAETTPAQSAPFGGNLSDLYAVYGDDTNALLEALNQLVNIDFPVYL